MTEVVAREVCAAIDRIEAAIIENNRKEHEAECKLKRIVAGCEKNVR